MSLQFSEKCALETRNLLSNADICALQNGRNRCMIASAAQISLKRNANERNRLNALSREWVFRRLGQCCELPFRLALLHSAKNAVTHSQTEWTLCGMSWVILWLCTHEEARKRQISGMNWLVDNADIGRAPVQAFRNITSVVSSLILSDSVRIAFS